MDQLQSLLSQMHLLVICYGCKNFEMSPVVQHVNVSCQRNGKRCQCLHVVGSRVLLKIYTFELNRSHVYNKLKLQDNNI